MRSFSINLSGRVKKFNLPKNKPLLPLFEAIVNSIHSIEERKQYDNGFSEGIITIKAVRDSQMIMHQIENASIGSVYMDGGKYGISVEGGLIHHGG